MDHDRSAAQPLLDAVVVNDLITIVLVPDLDAERVDIADIRGRFGIRRRQQEAEAAHAVDGPDALVLELAARDDQPLVRLAVEVQITGVEHELRVPFGHRSPLLVFGNETEGRLSRKTRIRLVGPDRRVDPATARDEPGARVVDDHDPLGGAGRTVFVGDGHADRVNAGLSKCILNGALVTEMQGVRQVLENTVVRRESLVPHDHAGVWVVRAPAGSSNVALMATKVVFTGYGPLSFGGVTIRDVKVGATFGDSKDGTLIRTCGGFVSAALSGVGAG